MLFLLRWDNDLCDMGVEHVGLWTRLPKQVTFIYYDLWNKLIFFKGPWSLSFRKCPSIIFDHIHVYQTLHLSLSYFFCFRSRLNWWEGVVGPPQQYNTPHPTNAIWIIVKILRGRYFGPGTWHSPLLQYTVYHLYGLWFYFSLYMLYFIDFYEVLQLFVQYTFRH